MQETNGLENFTDKNFTEIRRRIDLQREELKVDICKKIDDYFIEMINHTKFAEKDLFSKIEACSFDLMSSVVIW